jgi:hypothetical protein
MITNGLYRYSSKARDGVVGGADGVMILRDGHFTRWHRVLLFHRHLQLFRRKMERSIFQSRTYTGTYYATYGPKGSSQRQI